MKSALDSGTTTANFGSINKGWGHFIPSHRKKEKKMTTLKDKQERLRMIAKEIKKTNHNYRNLFEWHKSNLGLMGISSAILMTEAANILQEIEYELEGAMAI